eukprot:XP_016867689.1 uncharacterized protein LOC389602 isoform X1 [Homo sapiens]
MLLGSVEGQAGARQLSSLANGATEDSKQDLCSRLHCLWVEPREIDNIRPFRAKTNASFAGCSLTERLLGGLCRGWMSRGHPPEPAWGPGSEAIGPVVSRFSCRLGERGGSRNTEEVKRQSRGDGVPQRRRSTEAEVQACRHVDHEYSARSVGVSSELHQFPGYLGPWITLRSATCQLISKLLLAGLRLSREHLGEPCAAGWTPAHLADYSCFCSPVCPQERPCKDTSELAFCVCS